MEVERKRKIMWRASLTELLNKGTTELNIYVIPFMFCACTSNICIPTVTHGVVAPVV